MSRLFLQPDNGVEETWLWQTDVISTRNESESRFALLGKPNIRQSMRYTPIDQGHRQDFALELAETLGGFEIKPLWGWCSDVTSAVLSTATVIPMKTPQMGLAAGDFVFFANHITGEAFGRTTSAVTDTDVTLTTQIGTAVGPGWTVYKGMQGFVDARNNFAMDTVAGRLNLAFESERVVSVQRTGASASLTSFNSLPVLERDALAGVREAIDLPRDLTDFGVARPSIFTRAPGVKLQRSRLSFLVDRFDNSDTDYWRLFLDTTKGAWAAFLLDSQLDDIELGADLVAAATTLTAARSGLERFLDRADFANFQIHYSDGTTSQHTATDVTGTTITFTPALPNDPKVASVDRISYLLKCRGSDRIVWRHGPRKSTISFDVLTVKDG